VRSNVELKFICKVEKEHPPTPKKIPGILTFLPLYHINTRWPALKWKQPGWTSTYKEGAKGRGLQYMDSFNTCLLNNWLILKIPRWEIEYSRLFKKILYFLSQLFFSCKKYFWKLQHIFTNNVSNVKAAKVLQNLNVRNVKFKLWEVD